AQTGYRDDVHLPAPSYWPIVLCFSFPLIGYGLIFNLGFAFVGGAITLMALYGLALEPADDPDAGHDGGHDDHAVAPDGDEPAGDAVTDESATEEEVTS
ncbi:MAG: cytochrome ubiquinol oxidase subunit I, partial [Acidimicrobiales bacterium]|nr:cytochrome ubiquinol oxidase subunit I [Acidimicrobiales bacterium]